MGSDDLYRFKSFGPAPPGKPKPLPRSRNPRPSEEVAEMASEPAKALRQTPGPSSAEDLPPTPGNVFAGKNPEEVREKQPQRVQQSPTTSDGTFSPQPFIEFVRQLTDEEIHIARIKCETRLRESERNIERLKANIDDCPKRGPGSWRLLNDRIALRAEYQRRDGLAVLCDDYRQEEKRRQERAQRLPSLDYPKSSVKRNIRVILTNHPDFTDRQVCLQLDDDEIKVSSSRLKTKARSFQDMYDGGGAGKRKIEVMISHVRSDMRKHGLL